MASIIEKWVRAFLVVSLAREYTITYRGQLEPNETLIAGQFPAKGEVSVEEGISQRVGSR